VAPTRVRAHVRRRESSRALHRAMHRLNENAVGRVCERTRVYACTRVRARQCEWPLRGSKGGERFLVTIEPREMYYLFAVAPSAPWRARERRPSCDVRVHTEGTLFAEAVPGKENPRTMRESPFLLSGPRSRSFFIPGGRCATNALIAPARCLRRNDECADGSIN